MQDQRMQKRSFFLKISEGSERRGDERVETWDESPDELGQTSKGLNGFMSETAVTSWV